MTEAKEGKPDVTIVMAVYNGEEFLVRSIESVIHQNFSNWEMICINDGSSDDTASILEKYAGEDSRIRVVNQENTGQVRARQVGYRLGVGRYFLNCLDHDDYLAPDCLSSLLHIADSRSADVVLVDWMVERSPGRFASFISGGKIGQGDTITGIDAFSLTFPWRICAIGLWSKDLVKRYAVEDAFAFNRYDADEYLSRLILLKSQKIVVGSGKYFHCINPGSISTRASLRKMQSLDTNRRLIELARSEGLPSWMVWNILLYQRNYIANLSKMVWGMRHDLEAGEYKRAVTEILSSLRELEFELRESRRSAGQSRRDAELIIWKLRVRTLCLQVSSFLSR